MKKFGERLKKLRTENNITQEKLAEYLGVSFQAVSKWENSVCFPDISFLPAISNFFGVSSDYLLGIEQIKNEDKISSILKKNEEYRHTGEINKAISLLEEALKSFPNDHRLLAELIENKVMTWNDDVSLLDDIEAKANLILRDCSIDKIRHKTIVNLAFAYSFGGKKEKVKEISELLPDVAYSKKQLLSLAVPAKERAKYKADCILSEAESILCDILCISKHNIFWGDPKIAVDVAKRALKLIEALGEEGYLLYMQASAYEDMTLAYAKLENREEMYKAMEKTIDVYERLEGELKKDGVPYNSPLLQGLTFSKRSLVWNDGRNSFERYYEYVINSNTLKKYSEEKPFKDIVLKIKSMCDK